ncbi:MAG: magnesium transporter CorA family protein, partial [Ignavibacteriales bacterium]|nr:magnesium transporter CorA family protein [Ignavibacteriales bacterium]
ILPCEEQRSTLLVFINPDIEERNKLRNEFHVDDHTIASALDPDEVPRIEFGDERLFLIWKRPMNYSGEDNFFFNVASAGVFLHKNRLALVVTEEVASVAMGARQSIQLCSITDVLLNFLYNTVHHYLEHLKVIKMIAKEVQQRITMSMENVHLIQMFNLTESLVYYVNAINGNDFVLGRLRGHADKMNLPARTVDLLEDLIIENNQCAKQAEIYSSVFSGLMDARGNLVNNNMNILLKKLTVINIVFLPLNLIAGIGGMSEYSMMTQGVHWTISYTIFSIFLVIVGVLTAYLLNKVSFVESRSMRRSRSHKLRNAIRKIVPGRKR